VDFSGIDAAFGHLPRPEHFTNHQHCCECFDADRFFQALTPSTFALVAEPPETLPISFLTPDAFRYFMPGLMRMAAREGREYCLGAILFQLEFRLDTFTAGEREAVRDMLYEVYDRLQPQVHGVVFDYEAVWRILNRLDDEFARPEPHP
jgi:hypothetical protein